MEKKKVIVVAAIIRNQVGEILVAQRNAKKNYGLMWEFPGGKVEPEETHAQALARELVEELGIEAVIEPHCYAVTTDEHPTAVVELHFYRVEHFSGELTLHEHEASKWLKPSELGTVEFAPADIEVVKQMQMEAE